jgi:hypothetical protein
MKMRVSDNMKEQKGDLLSVATKFDDLYKVKSNPVNATTTLNAEKELRDSLVTALGFNGLLLDKTFKQLETELKNSIKKELKSGTRLGNGTDVPKSVKEFSRAIAAKKIIESGKMLTKTEIEIIVSAEKKKTLELFKKSELSLTKPPDPNATAPNSTAPNPPSAGSTLGEKIRNALYKDGKLKKGVKFVKYVLIAGGVGLAGYGIFAIFSDGSKIKLGDKYSEEVKKLLNPCLLPLLSNGGTIVPVSDGAQLQLKKTGNSEADSKGGVVYYPNGRVWTLDNSKKGTWSCSEIVKETMKPGTLKEVIRFRLKNLLNEQVDYDISIDGVNIKWDKSTSSSTQPKQQMRYTRCSEFPYKYGCKSEYIRKIQEKLEFEGRYITGNFGPVTKTKLKAIEKEYGFVLDDNIGITEDIYNKIMNFDSKSQPSAAQEKQNQNTIPYSKPESPFQNKVVSGAFSDLNAKKDTTAQTGTPTETASTETTRTNTTDTETDAQKIKRITEINGVLNERPFGNVAYRGVVLNPSDEGWLLSHVNEKYGENGKYTFVKNKDRERSLRGKEVIVFQRQRNK